MARGDAHPGADLDIVLLLQEGSPGGFKSKTVDGILVECHSFDFPTGREKVRENPMLTYGFVESRILYDLNSSLANLVELAHSVLQGYQTSPEEKYDLAYWMQCVRYKVASYLNSHDNLRASCILSTSTWQILLSLWAVNNKPMPPAAAVISHIRDLSIRPDVFDELLEELFVGDVSARINAGLTIIDWVLPLLEHKPVG